MLFLIKSWKIAVAAALLAVIYIQHLETTHLQSKLAAEATTIATLNAEGQRQSKHADEVANQQDKLNAALTNKLSDLQKVHAVTSAALADSVRRYARSRGPCQMPSDSDPAGEPPGSSGDDPNSRAIADSLAELTAAAQRDADRFQALQQWANTLAR